MKCKFVWLLPCLGLCIALPSCETTPRKMAVEYVAPPILTVGHGAFMQKNWERVIPTAEFIATIQSAYVRNLMTENARKSTSISQEDIERVRVVIAEAVPDTLLANALLIDWMIAKTEPLDVGHLSNVNNALRWYYVLNIQNDPVLPSEGEWTKGIARETAMRLQEQLGIGVLQETSAGGEDYCNECKEAGVPVPDFMFGNEWTYVGEVTDEFIPGRRSELWIHDAGEKGICLALPRYEEGTDDAGLFGVICLGTQTSRACFFDNPTGVKYKRGEKIEFTKSFVGGYDLHANGGGVCSDCHAGENPYVVHPEQQAFRAVLDKIQPMEWHDPIVHPQWPENPGPTNQLASVPSTRRCDRCHQQGAAGRFPKISFELGGYCGVLQQATGVNEPLTMPMPKATANRDDYIKHIESLVGSCSEPPTES